MTQRSWPVPPAPEAFHGLAGEIVRAVDPHSEADPVALLALTLAAFGNACGRGPGWEIGGTFHATNLYVLTVGRTSEGRKGTGWDAVKPVFARADPDWTRERVQGGLSSGEGLIHAVRDPQTKTVQVKERGKPTGEYVEEIEDHGVEDKRLLAREAEFASVLRVMRRDGSTLSTTVRSLWDSGDVRTLTKGKPQRATGAHVSIVGDITPDELRRELDDTSAANGFMNRFLLVCAKRSKELPFGGSPKPERLDELGDATRTSLRFAEAQGTITLDANAATLWTAQYGRLTAGRPGMFGAVTGRAAPQVRRLATLYALADMSSEVRLPDLRAALALWHYCEDSARYIFGARLGDHVADRLLEALREVPAGLTRSDMRSVLGNRITGERIDTALDLLREHGLARCERVRTGGRPVDRWFAVASEIVERTEESQCSGAVPSVHSVSSTDNRTIGTGDAGSLANPATSHELDADAELARLSAKGLAE
jgi:Protein of unknown function (DUF3987)